MTGGVICTRDGVPESRHRVHVAVEKAGGGVVARVGDPALAVFSRSAAKPFQALPLVEDGVADGCGLLARELAVCCASHGGEPRHLEAVRSVLEKAGIGEEALACGAHPPFHSESAARLAGSGEPPRPIHNNCSGKHAGMLALAVHRGWPTEGYHRPEHPVQRRMLEEMARWSRVAADEIVRGVDGCGVVCFGVPLARLAAAYARLAAAAAREEAAARIVGAMTGEPYYVGGTDRLCTRVMEVTRGRLFVKTGAEGILCAGVPAEGLGVALKVEDGAARAKGPALLRTLALLGVLAEPELRELSRFAEPEVTNSLGAVVGRVRAEFELEPGGA